MAREMSFVKLNSSEKDQFVWEEEDSINVNSTGGVAIILPAGISYVGVTVSVGAGCTVKVQSCTDKISNIRTGSGLTWIDWDAGSVTVDTQDECSCSVAAIRLFCVTAGSVASKMKVSAK
jgi:hypothetical protein